MTGCVDIVFTKVLINACSAWSAMVVEEETKLLNFVYNNEYVIGNLFYKPSLSKSRSLELVFMLDTCIHA